MRAASSEQRANDRGELVSRVTGAGNDFFPRILACLRLDSRRDDTRVS